LIIAALLLFIGIYLSYTWGRRKQRDKREIEEIKEN